MRVRNTGKGPATCSARSRIHHADTMSKFTALFLFLAFHTHGVVGDGRRDHRHDGDGGSANQEDTAAAAGVKNVLFIAMDDLRPVGAAFGPCSSLASTPLILRIPGGCLRGRMLLQFRPSAFYI